MPSFPEGGDGKLVDEMLKNSIIQPSTSSYASLVLLVKKKDR